METQTISSLEQMAEYAKGVLGGLEVQEHGATVLALKGDLGAGKTAFVKALAHELGVEDTVTSPTFVIMKKYQTNDARFTTLVHVDAYRLESAHELTILGWKNITSDPAIIIALEWPERVPEAVPANAVEIDFAYVNENTRHVTCNM